MKKHLFTLFFVCLLLALIPAVSAEDPTISVGSAEVEPGQSCTVEVALQNNSGFGGLEFSVEFDKTTLTLDSIDTSGSIAAFTITPVGNANKDGAVIFVYGGLSNVSGNGKIATLTFTAAENANGAKALTIVPTEGASFVYDGTNMLDLNILSANGKIKINGIAVKGDANGNGKVELIDALFALKVLLNDPADTDIDFDMNDDGKFSLADILRLLKLLVMA